MHIAMHKIPTIFFLIIFYGKKACRVVFFQLLNYSGNYLPPGKTFSTRSRICRCPKRKVSGSGEGEDKKKRLSQVKCLFSEIYLCIPSYKRDSISARERPVTFIICSEVIPMAFILRAISRAFSCCPFRIPSWMPSWMPFCRPSSTLPQHPSWRHSRW